jgi:HSP90 family molecular chaperone
MEFKAETKKLLDIVAKSIYTDKEVFVRELLSNCSDALEKQRYQEISGASGSKGDLYINVTTNDRERTLTIFDSGIGMNKQQIIDNLGTIAKSGSKEFRDLIDQDVNSPDSSAAESIIGQFGVGFYSSFIVSDNVEVYSRASSGEKGVRWQSTGDGEYELSEADNLDFERGTKIILYLKKDSL